MIDHFLWVEKFRPKTVADIILPEGLTKALEGFVATKNVPNSLFTGKPGLGKTTAAKAVLTEIGADFIVVNGSLNRNIDTLRNEIANFATTVSFSGGRKYVLIDEADYLNAQSTQPALRNFIEEYSRNCGFIMTCNYQNKLIEPLLSRLAVLDFTVPKGEAAKIAKRQFEAVKIICEKEGVPFDQTVVIKTIKAYFPDFRKVLNEIQKFSRGGFQTFDPTDIDGLVEMLKDRNFGQMRNWVAQNSDVSTHELFTTLYQKLTPKLTPDSVPQLILHLNKYDHQSAFVTNQELNTAACLTEVMADVKFL